MHFAGHNVASSCQPNLSFVPDKAAHYFVNAGLADNKCFIELVRQDDARDTGVAIERSAGPFACADSYEAGAWAPKAVP